MIIEIHRCDIVCVIKVVIKLRMCMVICLVDIVTFIIRVVV